MLEKLLTGAQSNVGSATAPGLGAAQRPQPVGQAVQATPAAQGIEGLMAGLNPAGLMQGAIGSMNAGAQKAAQGTANLAGMYGQMAQSAHNKAFPRMSQQAMQRMVQNAQV